MTPLVFVHGFLGGSEQWGPQEPLGKDRELICVDLPGFGKNAHLPPINTIRGFAEWVLADLTQRGVHKFDLLGHSMGGMIVQEMVHLEPSRINRLILYGTGPTGALPGRFEPIEVSMQRAREDGPKATARRIASKWFCEGQSSRAYPDCAQIAEASTLPAILAGLKAMQGWSGEENLQSIEAKTLVIWGDQDRSYPWSQIELLWSSIKNSSLAVVPSAGHATHLERPEVFNTLVSKFLDEHQ